MKFKLGDIVDSKTHGLGIVSKISIRKNKPDISVQFINYKNSIFSFNSEKDLIRRNKKDLEGQFFSHEDRKFLGLSFKQESLLSDVHICAVKIGDIVKSPTYGYGKITDIGLWSDNKTIKLTVQFANSPEKKFGYRQDELTYINKEQLDGEILDHEIRQFLGLSVKKEVKSEINDPYEKFFGVKSQYIGDGKSTIFAIKKDDEKVPLDLLDTSWLMGIGRILKFGATKYSPNNWRKGFSYSRLTAAAMRHIFAFNNGQDIDPETGESHLLHASCCLMFLFWHTLFKPELDDRWKGDK